MYIANQKQQRKMAEEDVKVVEDSCDMFEFTRKEYEEIVEKAMLNEELAKIFEMKILNYSITKISVEMNMSESAVNRRIKQLKKKIMKVI